MNRAMRMRNGNIFERIYNVTLYADCETYDIDEVLNWFKNSDYCKGAEWCYCIHDSDLLEDGTKAKTHLDFNIKFPTNKQLNSIISHLMADTESHSVVTQSAFTPDNDWKHRVQYCIHFEEHTPLNKCRYTLDDIVSNFDLTQYFVSDLDEVTQVNELYSFILDNVVCDGSVVLRYALDNGYYSAYRRGYTMFRDLLKENMRLYHNEK